MRSDRFGYLNLKGAPSGGSSRAAIRSLRNSSDCYWHLGTSLGPKQVICVICLNLCLSGVLSRYQSVGNY